MTEKVVSLSGGLVLGMVFALFLGIGATQHISSTSRFEVPSVMQMTIAQTARSTPSPASDSTPAVRVAAPGNEDRGRITRIATLAETTDPALVTTIAPAAPSEPKNWTSNSEEKIDTGHRRANLQRSYVAASNGTAASCYAVQVSETARQGSFSMIADNTNGRGGYGGGQTPSSIRDKPRTDIAQNQLPGNYSPDGHYPDLVVNGSSKPGEPDSEASTLSNDDTMRNFDPGNTETLVNHISNSGNQSESGDIRQSPRNRPGIR
jgi:hypothetical protein